MQNKLDTIVRLLESVKVHQLKSEKKLGAAYTEGILTEPMVNLVSKEVKPASDIGLMIEMLKKENKDVKVKCERMATQIRTKQQQIQELEATIRNSKPQLNDASFECSSDYSRYFVELSHCAEIVQRADVEYKNSRIVSEDLISGHTKSTQKICETSQKYNDLKADMDIQLRAESELLRELSRYKMLVLDFNNKNTILRDEKEIQQVYNEELKGSCEKYASELASERSLNQQLAIALTRAEKTSAAEVSTLANCTGDFNRALDAQSSTIEELRSAVRALEQQKEQPQKQQVRTPSFTVAAPPLEEDQSPSKKRARGNEAFPTSLPAAQFNPPTPLDANAGQTVSVALATTNTNTCPICNEKPFGLMVRCGACDRSYHSSCARRCGGNKPVGGAYICGTCAR